MSIDFAKEYLSIKHRSNKVVNDVNIPLALEPVMDKALESISGIHTLQVCEYKG